MPHRGEARRGRYTCVIAVVWPNGREITAEGRCNGIIRDAAKGTGGFGYDPLFYLPEYWRRQWRSYPWRKRIK